MSTIEVWSRLSNTETSFNSLLWVIASLNYFNFGKLFIHYTPLISSNFRFLKIYNNTFNNNNEN